MNNLINDLRLEIAYFNNFIIKNYLLGLKDKEPATEPPKFLFDAFYKLNTGLADCGALLKIPVTDVDQNKLFFLFNALISDAVVLIYLIEKSNDEEDLALNIKGILAGYLKYIIGNIEKYGKDLKLADSDIKDEIKQLTEDNQEYFNTDGSLKYQPANPSVIDAFEYLITNTQIPQLKSKFTDAFELYQFLSKFKPQLEQGLIRSENAFHQKINADVTTALNSITIILLAITYIEPFFEKPGQVSQEFVKVINRLLSLQNQVTK